MVTTSSRRQGDTPLVTVYLGCYAPAAERVSVVGAFNHWQPGQFMLTRHTAGWWHGAITLPIGPYAYRFWIESPTAPNGQWLADPENDATVESGYQTQHSLLEIG